MATRIVGVLLFGLLVPTSGFAERLPKTVMPAHYDLAFVVDLERARFDGDETIRVRLEQPTFTIVLHAAEIQFDDVTIGTGVSAQKAGVTIDGANDTVTLRVPKRLAQGPHLIHIKYSGVLNDKLRGFYLSHGKDRKYAVTQFESTDARRAFPSFDEPAFKATFAITVTADRDDTVISNGRVVSDVPVAGGKQHRVRFSASPKMSSYLVAVAVGDFACARGTAGRIPIRVCATRDKSDLTQVALESAEQILTFYNRYFTIRYPYGKLDILAVPDFAAGAMENTAAIFFRESDLLADSKSASVATRRNIASIIAHEMAHQWFGDLVTMRWWDDIWLNEGFATWMANRALAAWKPEWNIAVGEELETQRALTIDSLKSTRPVHATVETSAQIDEAFDVIAYQKGAAVLRMIESYVGPETFRKGVNAYLRAHAYGNVTSEDFWKAIAAASGKPVDRIMPTFINQPGFPLVDVSIACHGPRTDVTLTQQRFFDDGASRQPSSGERWQIPLCLRAIGSTRTRCEVLAGPKRTITWNGGTCPASLVANAGAQGYVRTAYPPEMLRAIALRVESDLNPPERLSLAADEWALVRAGRHSAADYLTLVSGYARETSGGVLAEVTGKLEFIHDYLSTDTTRPQLEILIRSLFQPVLVDIGFSATPSDSDERLERRAVVVGILGTTANDDAVVSKARTALEHSLKGGAPLEPALANAIVGVAASHGDEALYNDLVAAAERAVSPEDHDRYLYAVTNFRDRTIIDRALQRSLSSDIRDQDGAPYLARFFRNPVARARAWSFVKDQWTALQPKIGIFGGGTNFMSALGAFCDVSARDDIKTFFAAHPLPAATRTLDQTIERIDRCIDLKKRQTKAVSEWLASR